MRSDPRRFLKDAARDKGKTLKELSESAGKNHAYLQQFVERGVPKRLPEDVRLVIARMLGVDERDLGAPPRAEPVRFTEAEEYEAEQAELRGHSSEQAYDFDSYQPRLPGMIPELDGRLGAGEGENGEMLALSLGGEAYSGHRIVDEWLFPESYLRAEIGASISKTIVMPVKGDSMEPTYRPGDRVLVDLTQKTLDEDTVYVISDGEIPPRIKRLVLVLKSKPRLVRIVSDNPSIGDQELPLSGITIIGRVVGVVSRR